MDIETASKLVFPHPNPPFFYQHRNYRGQAAEPVTCPPLDDSVRLYGGSDVIRGEVMAAFDRVNTDRCGILEGDYVVLENGSLLIGRAGDCIVTNWPDISHTSAKRLNEIIHWPALWAQRARIIERWDEMPAVEHGAVISNVFGVNYSHFTFEVINSFRFLDRFDVREILMPEHCLKRRFQTDLVRRAMGPRKLITLANSVKVRDPVVIGTNSNILSRASVEWARRIAGASARPGDRRYYVRRSRNATTVGNNLSETPRLLALLREYGFETVEFGDGELTAAQQVARLDGAGIVLSVHGANLSNTAYLSPPLALIEVMGRRRVGSFFMQIALLLGFRYYGLMSDELDGSNDIVVDCDRLAAVLKEIAG